MASSENDDLLRGLWYLALPGRRLKKGQMMGKTLLGEPVLLVRAADGTPFAMRDLCPHRGIPLSHGEFDGSKVTCCYHGWMFAPDGRCLEVPSLLPEEQEQARRIRVRSYPCREVQGNIWIYFPSDGAPDEDDLPEVPTMPDVGDAPPLLDCSLTYPLSADDTTFTLMDPAHAAFVHTWWWWKKERRDLKKKRKEFEPAPLGWRQKRHPVPSQNRVYRLFGRDVTTEIIYRLPGMRIEHIRGDRHYAVSLLIMTPLTDQETEVHQMLYSTLPILRPLKPILRWLIRSFLDQDRVLALKHREGLAHDPPKMLLGDVDEQARWHFKLKREWQRAQEEDRPFENPLETRVLEWRS